MVLAPGPVVAAVEAVRRPGAEVVLLAPDGEPLTQDWAARRAAAGADLVLVAGRYEGIDARVEEILKPTRLSIGPYVLSGGEVAAMVVVEAVGRLVPGVLGNPASTAEESFGDADLPDAPAYTRPEVFRGRSVPEVLRSGDHDAIRAWREKERRRRAKGLRAAGGSDTNGTSPSPAEGEKR